MARERGWHRAQDGLAVSADGSAWYLVNASPDLRAQLLARPEFAPAPGTRDSPIRGVLLTSAELDHTLGLVTLREAEELTVYATSTVWHGLAVRGLIEPYTRLRWVALRTGEPVTLAGGVTVTPLAPGTKPPRYAADPNGPEWTVALRLQAGDTGTTLIYAPGLAAWTDEFAAAIRDAGVVLLDGTFATDGELPGRPGHLSIADTLPLLPPGPRYLYTHLNNTNPFAVGHAVFGRDDVGIATDGTLLEL